MHTTWGAKYFVCFFKWEVWIISPAVYVWVDRGLFFFVMAKLLDSKVPSIICLLNGGVVVAWYCSESLWQDKGSRMRIRYKKFHIP